MANHRDFWDLQWLKKQGAKIDIELIHHKTKDYHVKNYLDCLNAMIQKLPELIHGHEFRTQMLRFIPLSAQESTLKKPKFYDYLEIELTAMLKDVLSKW
jgi:hypothetical protein